MVAKKTAVQETIKPACCDKHATVVTWAKLVALLAAVVTLLNLLGVGFASNQRCENIEIQVERNREDINAVMMRVERRLDYIQKRIDK